MGQPSEAGSSIQGSKQDPNLKNTPGARVYRLVTRGTLEDGHKRAEETGLVPWQLIQRPEVSQRGEGVAKSTPVRAITGSWTGSLHASSPDRACTEGCLDICSAYRWRVITARNAVSLEYGT